MLLIIVVLNRPLVFATRSTSKTRIYALFLRTSTTMNSGSKECVYVGFSTTATARKTVRFAAETTKEILEKSTWRKAPEPRSNTYVLSARGQLGMAVIRFTVSKMLFVRLPTARRAHLEVSDLTLLA